jgi:hypothetical protein
MVGFWRERRDFEVFRERERGFLGEGKRANH